MNVSCRLLLMRTRCRQALMRSAGGKKEDRCHKSRFTEGPFSCVGARTPCVAAPGGRPQSLTAKRQEIKLKAFFFVPGLRESHPPGGGAAAAVTSAAVKVIEGK